MVWVRRHILLAIATLIVFIASLACVWPDARKAFAQIFVPTGCYNHTTSVLGVLLTPCPTPSPPPTPPPPTPTPSPTATPTPPPPTPTPSPTPTPTPTPSPTPTPVPTGLGLVQTASLALPTVAQTSMVPVLAATPAAGTLMLACATTKNGATISTPAGYNVLMAAVNGTFTFYEFWKYAGPTEPASLTLTASASDFVGAALRNYRGVNPTNPFSNVGLYSQSPTQLTPASMTLTPWISGTMPVSCFTANSKMGVTAHTAGTTEDYTGYSSAQSGNGIVSPFNATEGQTGTVSVTATPVPVTHTASWNVTSGNGPVGLSGLVFLAPVGTVSPVSLGYVSTITGTGFTANCGIVNFGSYGCFNVTTTGATISGTPAVGSFFQAFGTVNAPTVTANHVDFNVSPFAGSPTPPPTVYTSVALSQLGSSGAFYPLSDNPQTSGVLIDLGPNHLNGLYGTGALTGNVDAQAQTIVTGDTFSVAFPGGPWLAKIPAKVTGTNAALQCTTQCAINLWAMAPSAVQLYGTLASLGQNTGGVANTQPFFLGIDNTTTQAVYLITTTTGTYFVESTINLAPLTIYNLAGEYTGTAIQLYINGTLNATAPANGTITGYATSTNFAIGAQPTSDIQPLNAWGGSIQNVYLSTVAQTPTQISALYAVGQGAPVPTPAPTATPIVGSCPAVPTLTNGLEYATPFTPYGCSASPTPWTQLIPTAPTVATWSATLIGHQFASGNSGTSPITIWPGVSDFGYSIYYASATDALVTVTCSGGGGAGGCNNTDNGGFSALSQSGTCTGISSCTFHIRFPAGLRFPLSNGDTRVSVVQPNGTQIDFYCFGCNQTGTKVGSGAGGNWQTGDTVSMLAADNCGNWTTSSGWINANNGNVGAAGACGWAGAVTSNEIIAGYIPHAIAATYVCQGLPTGSTVVFPALGGATQICTNGTNGVGFGPPLGGRLWYANQCNATHGPVTTANFPNGLPGSGYSGWELAILCAYNQHGSYFTDNGSGGAQISGGVSIFPSGGEMFFAYGNDPWSRTVATYGWFTQSNSGVTGVLGPRYYGVSGQSTWTPPGFTNAYFQANFKWLDPCEAHVPRTC